MTHEWLPPAPELLPSPRERNLGRLLAIAIVVVVGGLGVAFLALGDRGDGHPGKWDPRVAELVEFVARERELDFDHPVAVEFVDRKEFEEELTADEGELTAEERDEPWG
jgi:hypothetical protein